MCSKKEKVQQIKTKPTSSSKVFYQTGVNIIEQANKKEEIMLIT